MPVVIYLRDNKKKIVLFLVLTGIFMIAGLYLRQVTRPKGYGDSAIYLAMAKSVWTFTQSPWGYRIAVPYSAAYLAYYLRVPLETMFLVLQVGMYAVTVVALFVWFHIILRVRVYPAVLGLLLFVFSYPGLYNLHNTVHVGFAEHLLLVLGCIFIYQDRYFLLLLLVAVSGFVKETIGLLLIPTYLMVNLVTRNWIRLLVKTILLLVVFIGISLLLRSGILFRNPVDLSDYSSFYNREYLAYVFNYWGGLINALELVLYTFGPVWLLAIAGVIQSPARLKAMLILPVLAILQITLGTDLFRMVGVGFPVVLAYVVVLLDRMGPKWASIFTGVSLFYALTWNHDIAPNAALWGSLTLTLLLLVLYLFRDRFTRWAMVQTP